MMMMRNVSSLLALSLALGTVTALSAGCSTSGGKQESVVNNASTSSDVKGSVSTVNSHAQDVFKEMGIGVTGSQSKESGKKQELTGKAGDKTVTVELSQVSPEMTHVQVTAKEGSLQWNEDYAQQVLSKLIQKS
jgi:hypothetical protein